MLDYVNVRKPIKDGFFIWLRLSIKIFSFQHESFVFAILFDIKISAMIYIEILLVSNYLKYNLIGLYYYIDS